MPRAVLPLLVAREIGTTITWTAAQTDGLAVPIRGGVAVFVRNASAAAITVTLPTPGVVEGLAIEDRAVSVPVGAIVMIRPTAATAQPDGTAHLNFSASPSVDAFAVSVT